MKFTLIKQITFSASNTIIAMAITSTCLLPSILTAAETLPLMYQNNIIHEFEVDFTIAVIPNRNEKNYTAIQLKQLSKFSLSRLARLGLTISKSGDITTEEVVGNPIWFDRSEGAVGVLTKDVVVKTSATFDKDNFNLEAWSATAVTLNDIAPNLYLVSLNKREELPKFITYLSTLNDVVYAHPDFIIPKDFRSSPLLPENEEFFSYQWHLENTGQTKGAVGADIKAKDAWSITEGSSDIKIAIIDSGFDIEHVDLKDAWDKNTKEIANNRKDDDGNGYVDDVIGWNFSTNSASIIRGYDADHGTAVAGLIAAQKNGFGTIGVCPSCKLIPIATSFTPTSDARAFLYALKRGADIISNSWGYDIGTPQTQVVVDAIKEAAKKGRNGKGTVILFAMNNINRDDCIGSKPDISSIEEVVAISGSSHFDKKVSSSAWGKCMEFLSPTRDSDRLIGIVSTDVTGKYGYNAYSSSYELPNLDYTKNFGGTSAATPISAGAFGLALSLNPNLTRSEVIEYFKIGADKINPSEAQYDNSTGFSLKYGYGRINVFATLKAISPR